MSPEPARDAESVVPEDPIRPEWRAVDAVLHIHSKRMYDGDGYGWAICIEDRQHWPCATVKALEELGYGGGRIER